MKRPTLRFCEVPDWTYAGAKPGILTFFEAMALANLEERAVRLSASLQRKLLGFPVFGRREITVLKSGEVRSVVSTGFGMDCEAAVYSPGTIRRAVENQKQLRPGTTGARFL